MAKKHVKAPAPPDSGTTLGVLIPRIDVRQMEITVIGDSPLICNAWSAKAVQQMLDKQMKKAKAAKSAKDPQADFEASLYKLPDGGFGFPAIGFKAAAVSACRFSDGVKMTSARGAFHIDAEFVKIEGTPTPRQDMVRVGMGVADIRFRGEFKQWRASFIVSYNSAALSPEQIVNLFNLAGFGVGIGEWRPERDGQSGRFHVATTEEF